LEEEGYNMENLQYALMVSGLDGFIAKLPEGPDKIITENGKNISGGQQQRIAIARALYKKAGLILLDEPFNELDEVSTISLLEHFRELSLTGKIVIMITHDKKSLSYCNKIISLDEQ
jgi:ABC-type bacteriocin/lantibiotic exporter with double-glycine peptidase domain